MYVLESKFEYTMLSKMTPELEVTQVHVQVAIEGSDGYDGQSLSDSSGILKASHVCSLSFFWKPLPH